MMCNAIKEIKRELAIQESIRDFIADYPEGITESDIRYNEHEIKRLTHIVLECHDDCM